MSAVRLDGQALADKISLSLKPRIAALGRPPRLLIVAGAADAGARAYRRAQLKACEHAGITAELLERAPSASELASHDAVIVDLPLPAGVDKDSVLASLTPDKDVEGAAPYSFGRLFLLKRYEDLRERGLAAPCTALAVAELLRETRVPLAGKSAVVIGRSNIVGKPAAHLLSCLDITVTLCHSKTRDLAKVSAAADIVVAAAGKPKLVKASWIKPGAIVIDAGINSVAGKICGDVDPAAFERSAFYTPVPGGVGPVTTAMLLVNTVALAEKAGKNRER